MGVGAGDGADKPLLVSVAVSVAVSEHVFEVGCDEAYKELPGYTEWFDTYKHRNSPDPDQQVIAVTLGRWCCISRTGWSGVFRCLGVWCEA